VKVLVTGGRGFLARVVATVLSDEGHEVTLMSRGTVDDAPDRVRVCRADLREAAQLRAVAPGTYDGVVHLAGLGNVRDSIADPVTYFEVNTAGTINLLRAIAESSPDRAPMVVFASTQTVYGTDHPQPTNEDMTTRPENPYAASKLAAEHVLIGQARTGAIRATIFRMVNLAGGHDGVGDSNARGLIPRVIRAAERGDPVDVNGTGDTVRDYLHVTDAADAISRALRVAGPGDQLVCNLGSGRGSSVVDVIAAVETITGHDVRRVTKPPVPEPQTLIVDNARARQALNWTPTHSTLTDIVRDAWHSAHAKTETHASP
jgi:UDP-glucose 4-epimerase